VIKLAGEKVEFNERGYRDIDKKRTRKVTKTFLENNNIPIWFMPMIGFGFDDEGNLVKQKVNSDGEITVSEISELLTAINTLLNSQDADNNLNVKHTGSIVAEVKDESDADESNIITFSANIESIEIYHNETTQQEFTVNGLTLKVAPGGWRSPVAGTASDEVTIPADVTCTISRLI